MANEESLGLPVDGKESAQPVNAAEPAENFCIDEFQHVFAIAMCLEIASAEICRDRPKMSRIILHG